MKVMDGAVALVVTSAGSSEPLAQLTVFTDDSYPSGVLSFGGMDHIAEVDLNMLMTFFEAIKAKGKTKPAATRQIIPRNN